MRDKHPRWLFTSLLFLDGLIAGAATLVGQWLTLGFDPIFYNPVLIFAVGIIFAVIESYLPFLFLYGYLFDMVLRKTRRVSPAMLCWVLFVALNFISLSVAVLSFGGHPNPVGILIPVGVNTMNLAVFFQRKVRMSRGRTTEFS